MADQEQQVQPSHVVMLPYIAQGHIKPLLCLAQLLSQSGLYITFLNTHHNHKRFANLQALSKNFPNLHFDSISDGLPDDHPRPSFDLDYFLGINVATKPHFKDLLLSYRSNSSHHSVCRPPPPVTCIIADGVLSFPVEVAEELEIPIFSFCSHTARYLWEYYTIAKLIGKENNEEEEINPMPGFDLGCEDLPGFDMEILDQSPSLQVLIDGSLAMQRTSGLIINTIDDLEASSLPHIVPRFRKVYTVAPLHALLNSRLGDRSHVIASDGSLWNADQDCMTWLDSQPLRSVLYVSFGSLVKLSHSQLVEFLHGLVLSGYPFLWVIRQDVLFDDDTDGVIEKEYQCINSACVVKLWRIGVQLDAIDGSSIQSTINTLMGNRRDEFQRSVDRIAKLAEDGISEDLPGFKIEQVKVEVEDHTVLHISCEKSINKKEINYKWYQVETKINDKILKRFKLPENVKVDTIKASMDNNGVLTITIPKDKLNK
ncbi:hypothetical protein FEM48_Zijuj11G0100500 [Ziziphus jujuba var. spinosa]|uniref:SHSP domain-containing protein n=1 Tax=Ziziphus jujuba var. spinosa TaxID=714518 RepID=A0A978UIB1_ZIZJJ|nr:hypothetical protein FEM48_Zijuj11G0100500 [Ziziphus jujuba var. spinosa]